MHLTRSATMTTRLHTSFAALALLFGLGPFGITSAHAVTYCVENALELQTTLEAAVSNTTDDVIRIEAGIYRSSSPNGFYVYNFSSESHDLEISGGWTADCALRLPGQRSTIDGELQRPALVLGGTMDVRGELSIRHLQFLNGYSTDGNRAGGLTVNRGFDVVLESNLFRGNTLENDNTIAGAALYVLTEGPIAIRGNVFVDNDADSTGNAATGAVSMGCYSFSHSASFTNNTVTGNTADVGGATDISGVRVTGFPNCTWTLANNILWGNDGLDLYLDVASVTLRNNDIQNRAGSQLPVASVGNVNVNPQFVSATNLRLRRSSPLIDDGINGPVGGLPLSSFDAGPRVVGLIVDMGAYELDVLMANGFDSSPFGL